MAIGPPHRLMGSDAPLHQQACQVASLSVLGCHVPKLPFTARGRRHVVPTLKPTRIHQARSCISRPLVPERFWARWFPVWENSVPESCESNLWGRVFGADTFGAVTGLICLSNARRRSLPGRLGKKCPLLSSKPRPKYHAHTKRQTPASPALLSVAVLVGTSLAALGCDRV